MRAPERPQVPAGVGILTPADAGTFRFTKCRRMRNHFSKTLAGQGFWAYMERTLGEQFNRVTLLEGQYQCTVPDVDGDSPPPDI